MATYNGTSGADSFAGGGEDDVATGNGGTDSLAGAAGNDDLAGNAGADTLDGGDGGDTLYAGDRSPLFTFPEYIFLQFPGPGLPLLDTGSDPDVVRGGAGDDRLFVGYGDTADGGADGVNGDRLYISFLGAPSGVTFDFRQTTQTIGGGTISGIEYISWIQGSNFADTLNAGDSVHTDGPEFTAIFAGAGNDTVTAGRYTATMYGEDGDDIVDGRGSIRLRRIEGGAGNDVLYVDTASANGGSGNDTIYSGGIVDGGAGNDRIELSHIGLTTGANGGEGNDFITATATPSIGLGVGMVGGRGSDTLAGTAIDDTLSGGEYDSAGLYFDLAAEHDVIDAGAGNDTVSIGYGDDADGGTGTDGLNLYLDGSPGAVTLDLRQLMAGQTVTIGGGTIKNFESLNLLRTTSLNDSLIIGNQAASFSLFTGAG